MSDPDKFQYNSQWLTRLINNLNKIKHHWKWVGRILTIAAIAYVVLLLAVSWPEIQAINWQNYILVIVIACFIYLISLMLQLFVWLRLISQHHKISWYDVEIYTRTIMLRQLPGGVWHWLGRSTIYQSSTTISAKTILYANMLDWCLILITAFGVYGLFATELSIPIRGVLLALSVVLILFISQSWFARKQKGQQIIEGLFLSMAYMGSWIMGGLILYLLITNNPESQITLPTAITIWAVAGGISSITIIAPSGFGIRELSLTFLLQPFVSVPVAIILALLLRLIFTFADFVWGSLGWLISREISNRKGHKLPQSPPNNTNGLLK